MRTDEMMKDPVLQVLAGLPVREPDRRRVERTRARCRAAIERRMAKDLFLERLATSFSRFLQPALVAALCAVFLIEVARRALQLYRL